MTQATDIDIREIKELITAGNAATQKQIADLAMSSQTQIADLREEMRIGFTKIDGKFDTVNARLTNLETNTKAIADLAEKVGELKNWKQIAIVIFTATVGGAIGWFVRTGKM